MKPILTFAVFCLFIAGCKKEITQHNSNAYMQNAKTSLRDSMNGTDYANLDFSKAVVNTVDSAGLYFMRIPFMGKKVAESFVIIKTGKDGNIEKGKIIQLKGGVRGVGDSLVIQREWEGSISISSLDRASVLVSDIQHGYITAFHPSVSERSQLKGPDDMPEVVIVTYVNRIPDYSTWFWLNGFFSFSNMEEGDSGGYYYGSGGGGDTGGGYYSGGGGSNGGNDGSPATDPTILVDVDTYVEHPAIDIDKYLNCFSSIPDQGAACSIEIFTDIPVDNDPTKLFNWNTESPGHTFLQLKKTSADGNQSVMQNIGFYPQSTWKNVLNADPVKSKIVDDGNHEFNGSLSMNLNAFSFSSVLGKIKELSTMNYDVDEFNCTDFALEVFNYVRNPIQIPQYPIPGSVGTIASNTPQGLYIKLREMLNTNNSESANIKLPGVKGWVSDSHGPCN